MTVALTLTDEQVAAVKAAMEAPPAVVASIHSMAGLTDAARADIATATYWQQKCGDWVDAAGALNGPKPTYSGSGATATVDVTGMDDVMIVTNSVTKVVLDGVDVSSRCFWTDPTSNHTLALPGHYGRPVIVPNPAGKSLTFTSTGGAWRVDKVALPKAVVPALVRGYTPPNILRIDPTGFDAVVIPGSVPAASTATNRCFAGAVTYETDQGVPYAKAHCPAVYYPTIGYGRVARCDYPVAPVPELYVAYLLNIGPDVWDAVTDIGVKLSGMGGNEGRWSIGEHISSYTPIYTKNLRNRPIIALRDYFYSAEASSGQGAGNGQYSDRSFGYLRSPGWTLIEHGAIANTFNADGTPNADGVKRTWINGALVEDRKIKWFASAASKWTTMSLQIYHGGTGSYATDCWYGIGPFMCSTQHIGVDPAFEPLIV